jgi:hypothetical protein
LVKASFDEKGPNLAHLGDKLHPDRAYATHVTNTLDGAVKALSLPQEQGEGEMLRTAASKVMWVGRATVFLVGLAVILALVFGVGSMALGANGNPFLLGRNIVATAITALAGPNGVNGPMLGITNNNAGTNDTALALKVQAGEAPMSVSSSKVVTNLNADKVDGSDAPLWAVVYSTGTFDRAKGVATGSNARVSDGSYKVTFNRDVSKCAYSATIDDGNSGEPSFTSSDTSSKQIHVFTANSSGVLANRAFQLVVFC